MVSREIERRIPTAAKLMMSDEPPALMNGSVMPVIGTSATTTAMLMNAWMHSQAVMPGRKQRPEGIGRGERDPDARVREDHEQGDDDRRRRAPELLADDREDEVVAGVREEQAAGQPALAEPRAEDAAEPERDQPLDRVVADAGGSAHGSRNARMRSSW